MVTEKYKVKFDFSTNEMFNNLDNVLAALEDDTYLSDVEEINVLSIEKDDDGNATIVFSVTAQYEHDIDLILFDYLGDEKYTKI